MFNFVDLLRLILEILRYLEFVTQYDANSTQYPDGYSLEIPDIPDI